VTETRLVRDEPNHADAERPHHLHRFVKRRRGWGILPPTISKEGILRTRTTLMLGGICAGMLASLAVVRAEAPAAPAKPAAAPATPAAAPGKPVAAPAAPAAAEAAAAHERPVVAGDTVHWDKMSVSEKRKHMKKVVLPEMKKVFQEFDAKTFAKFNCNTCHGEKAEKNKFKMPNPDLPKLPQPTDRAAFMALSEKKPEVTKFMGTKVKPEMARLLGLEEFNLATKVGFGCYACHTKMEPKDAPSGGAAAPANEGAAKAAGKPAGGW
jgi:hypothetical protein